MLKIASNSLRNLERNKLFAVQNATSFAMTRLLSTADKKVIGHLYPNLTFGFCIN